MKMRDKNPLLKEEIGKLAQAGVEKPVWRAVARGLNKPRRGRYEVNLARIQRFAAENDTIVVPGMVLGDGAIEKKVTVAAIRFSAEARRKIEKAGGSCLPIGELFSRAKDSSKIRIMG